MRPEHLEVVGFGVFRELTEIDFSGAELFALSGPTGSGKSTVIDAIVFALFGCVPRYDNKTLVAPVISQGKVECRVRLDFTVAGSWYRVVRVVRASGRGATTKEARLEHVLDSPNAPAAPALDARVAVLAGAADEVTSEIEKLLGLTYEHFTTCVVLPQGEFQRFLHQKPSARQDLLVELLDLGVYARMAQLARGRSVAAEHERGWISQQLVELAGYTEAHRGEISSDIAKFETLLAAIDEALPVIDSLSSSAAAARVEIDAAEAAVMLLSSIVEPAGMAALADDLANAAEAVAVARRGEEIAESLLASAEAAFAEGPDRAALETIISEYSNHVMVLEAVAKAEEAVVEARERQEDAARCAEESTATHLATVEALEHARRTDRALEFAATLAPGDPCPVCLSVVVEMPTHEVGDMRALISLERTARATADSEHKRRVEAEAATKSQCDLLDELRSRVIRLDERLANQPPAAMLQAQLVTLELAERELAELRDDEQHKRRTQRAAEKAADELGVRELAARRHFDQARDSVSLLSPPPARRIDLAEDWRDLLGWAHETAVERSREVSDSRARKRAAEAEAEERTDKLLVACLDAGLDVRDRPLRDVVVEAFANARVDLESLDAALERASSLREQDSRLSGVAQVAGSLASHLRSTGFERWVLDEVLRRLVAGATEILRGLSNGAYSLSFDARSNFMVIDHHNADVARSARSLSGGETFLASLALALALADEVANLAGAGTVRLESIFLDEGFGTLDPDTLDTVASAIEELGSTGRMVGLVTHVRDLAERMPVRYEISRSVNSSTVVRVDS